MEMREPSRTTSASCSTRSNLTCRPSDKSPISSRNRLPLCALSNQPRRLLAAPVKAPFSCPNSSLSTNCSAMAPQLTATNARSRRWLSACKWRATISLPVPVSPVMSTVASLAATRSICSSNARERGSSKTSALARTLSAGPLFGRVRTGIGDGEKGVTRGRRPVYYAKIVGYYSGLKPIFAAELTEAGGAPPSAWQTWFRLGVPALPPAPLLLEQHPCFSPSSPPAASRIRPLIRLARPLQSMLFHTSQESPCKTRHWKQTS